METAHFRPWFREALDGAIDDEGEPVDRDQILPHALRGSAATTLMRLDLKKLLLEIWGRWRHDTEHTYFRFSLAKFAGIARALFALTVSDIKTARAELRAAEPADLFSAAA